MKCVYSNRWFGRACLCKPMQARVPLRRGGGGGGEEGSINDDGAVHRVSLLMHNAPCDAAKLCRRYAPSGRSCLDAGTAQRTTLVIEQKITGLLASHNRAVSRSMQQCMNRQISAPPLPEALNWPRRQVERNVVCVA